MASPDVAESYIRLGLRLGRHVDGLVDAYYGPPELKEQVDAEPLAEAGSLVAEAEELLAALEDGWLSDQARGLRTYAGVLAGEEVSYSDEVEGSYGIRPQRVSTEVYAAAHDRLEELLPGAGALGERFAAWRRGRTVPRSRVVAAMRAVAGELRACTAELVELPAGEEVVFGEVRDEPWWAFNYYLGGLRSRVVVNTDRPTTFDDVVELVGHEVYPGHHTEHALKEQLLARGEGLVEETIMMVPTPAVLIGEGIAETGPDVVLDAEAEARIESVLRKHGFDGGLGHDRAVREARRPLRRLWLDAALMIHEDGATQEQAQAHVERWGLATPEEAAQSVRFVTDPTWRAYAITYSAGRELCHAWVGGDPARFVHLLTEQSRVRDLLAEVPSRT